MNHMKQTLTNSAIEQNLMLIQNIWSVSPDYDDMNHNIKHILLNNTQTHF